MAQTLVLDATNLIVGRLASHAAKAALNGSDVRIINAEKAIMTGRRAFILPALSRIRAERGQIRHGPFMHRRPDMFVRRIVRGMLPWSKQRGREAFKRVMCYVGVPPELKGAKAETIESAHIRKLSNLNYMAIGDICKHLGAQA